MNTTTKLMSTFILAGLLAFCSVLVLNIDDYDADISDTDTVEMDGVGYATINAAFNAAVGGETIKVIKETTLSDTLNIIKDITIDLNGMSVNSSPYYQIRSETGKHLTITDSSEDSDGKIICTISSAYSFIIITGDTTQASDINSKVTLEAGTITSSGAANVFIGGKGAELEVLGGKIENTYRNSTTDGNFCISTNGSWDSTNNRTIYGNFSIEISGGEIVSEQDCAIYLPAVGTTTISGGSITGWSAIEIDSGTLDISGGEFYSTYNGDGTRKYKTSGDGNYNFGAVIAIVTKEGSYDSHGKMEISISGGSFTSKTYKSIDEYNLRQAQGKTGTHISNVSSFEVTGGTFESPILSDYWTGFITGGFFKELPTEGYIDSDYTTALVSGYYYVGEESTSGEVIVTEEDTLDDDTTVTTESTITIDDSGVATYAEVKIETDDSKAMAKVDSTGSTSLISETKGTLYLTDSSVETLVELSQQISGSASVSIDVRTAGTTVSIGSAATTAVSDGSLILSITMNSGSSSETTIALNSDSLEDGITYELSVAGNSSKASKLTNAGLTGLTPFDLGLYVDDEEAELSGSVTVSIPVQEKYDNMRLYCLDEKKFYSVSYRNGAVTATLPHFSTWAIVYDKPVVVTEDDDDILFILEQQKKAQEAASAQTTSDDNSGEEAAVIIAAAAVAGAMLACAFFAFRRP